MSKSPEDLKAWRKSRNLTQAEAAASLNISQEMWSMMESGVKAIPSLLATKLEGASPSHAAGGRGPYKK